MMPGRRYAAKYGGDAMSLKASICALSVSACLLCPAELMAQQGTETRGAPRTQPAPTKPYQGSGPKKRSTDLGANKGSSSNGSCSDAVPAGGSWDSGRLDASGGKKDCGVQLKIGCKNGKIPRYGETCTGEPEKKRPRGQPSGAPGTRG